MNDDEMMMMVVVRMIEVIKTLVVMARKVLLDRDM